MLFVIFVLPLLSTHAVTDSVFTADSRCQTTENRKMKTPLQTTEVAAVTKVIKTSVFLHLDTKHCVLHTVKISQLPENSCITYVWLYLVIIC